MTAKGDRHTMETRRKMSVGQSKRPVIAIGMKAPYNMRVYESTRAAVGDGFASSNITATCKGRVRHCYGFYWRYLEDFKNVETVLAEAKARKGHKG